MEQKVASLYILSQGNVSLLVAVLQVVWAYTVQLVLFERQPLYSNWAIWTMSAQLYKDEVSICNTPYYREITVL